MIRAFRILSAIVTVVAIGGCGGGGASRPAAISINPDSLLFLASTPDETTASQTVQVANAGGTAALELQILIEGTDAALFSFSSDCSSQLAPGAHCKVMVAFLASADGLRSATLKVRFHGGAESRVMLSASIDPAGRQIPRLKAYLRGSSPVAPYVAVTTVLARDVDAGTEVMEVADARAFPQEVPFIVELRAGSAREYVLVTDRTDGVTWSVIRGYGDTTATAFTAAATSVAWLPVIHQRGTVINGLPLGEVVARFTGSVSGASGGQLAEALPNGIHRLTFPDGEVRDVTVREGFRASWSPALGADAMTTAEATPVRYPAGVMGNDPLELLAARFDRTAPVYITQAARLARRGAILTTALPLTGATTLGVDATADFPQDGDFVVRVDDEDLRVRVADATTLAIVQRGANATRPVQITDAATSLHQVLDVDTRTGGTQAFLVPGSLNSGLRYLGIAPTVGPLVEYMPKQPLCLNFYLDGASFELLASGNVSALLLVDGVIQHSPDQLVEPSYGGRYWHRFDFGSPRMRRITLLLSGYPMAIAHAPGSTIHAWDRSAEPLLSYDGDSFGQTEGYLWSAAPNGGGLGFFLETALELGLTQIDYGAPVGGTGYSQEGSPLPPAFPRPKYSGVNRVTSIAAGPAPLLFIGALGHNDNTIDRVRFAADARAYWAALRHAWPETIFVATQFYFPAADREAPGAFLPNPLSTPNDLLIQQALASAGGAWIYVNTNEGRWANSRGVSGTFGIPGQPLLTGGGYGGASGYRGGHSTGVGNGDLMIRDDGVHPSNIGARYLGTELAAAIRAAVQAL